MIPTFIIILSAWALGWVFLPLTFWRDNLRGNAKNWPGVIVMRRGLDCPGAVWAQEFYEARRGWRWLPVSVPALMLGRFIPRLDFWRRYQELMGHEIEVWAEYELTEASRHAVRLREADALTRYPAFKGWTSVEIYSAMQKCSPKACRFVRRHWNKIEKIGEGK